MAWTAMVLSLTPTRQGFEVSVVLSDATQKFVESFQTDEKLTTLRNQVRARTVVVDVIHTKPEFAVGDVLDLATDPVVPPADDPAGAARTAFLVAYALYQGLVRGQSAGLVDAGAVTAQHDAMKALYLPDYASIL